MKIKYPVLIILFIATFLFIFLGWSDISAYSPDARTQGIILYVKSGADGTCTSWTDACELQSALSIAASGDQVWVAAGTYKPTTDLDRTKSFQLKSGVAIYGGFPASGGAWADRDWEAYPTILSGDIGVPESIIDNSYHVVRAESVNATAVMDGFEVRHGFASSAYTYPHYTGGGMYNNLSSPTLINILFMDNRAGQEGGGMHNNYSSPTLNNVTFDNNLSGAHGGGMYNDNSSSPTLTNVTFTNNNADYGGGVYNYQSSPTLINVTFNNNDGFWDGGGMYNDNSSSPTLSNVIFIENSTNGHGGGMYNDYGSPTLNNVTFTNNTADYGGGMYNYGSNPTLADVTFSGNSAAEKGGGMYSFVGIINLTNVTFSGNSALSGGGIFNSVSSPTLTNVTFSGNSAVSTGGGMLNASNSNSVLINVTFIGNSAGSLGGGMYNNESSPTLTNSILWGNTPDQVNNDPDSTATITYSDIQGGYTGTGNINDDPLLGPLADNGGFTHTHALGEESPAIDAGDPTSCPMFDQRGFDRPIDGDEDGIAVCDMGAYEYGGTEQSFSLYLPLIVR